MARSSFERGILVQYSCRASAVFRSIVLRVSDNVWISFKAFRGSFTNIIIIIIVVDY